MNTAVEASQPQVCLLSETTDVLMWKRLRETPYLLKHMVCIETAVVVRSAWKSCIKNVPNVVNMSMIQMWVKNRQVEAFEIPECGALCDDAIPLQYRTINVSCGHESSI